MENTGGVNPRCQEYGECATEVVMDDVQNFNLTDPSGADVLQKR